MKDLKLELIGFTEEEIDAMRSWCDWDDDGTISYDECVGELADAVLTQMENSNTNNESIASIVAKLEAQVGEQQSQVADKRKELSKKNQETRKGGPREGDGSPQPTSSLPPLLLTYLTDTFEAYDVDNNGELDEEEFFQMIRVLNLGLNDDNIDAVRSKFKEWDASKDGKIAWSEALPKFNDLLHSMCDKKQDKWIGLCDKANDNQLFWYNLKDEQSQWMSAEDQEAFRANPYHVPPHKRTKKK
jgi:Ca2+-binding EF-hand superfamily protein